MPERDWLSWQGGQERPETPMTEFAKATKRTCQNFSGLWAWLDSEVSEVPPTLLEGRKVLQDKDRSTFLAKRLLNIWLKVSSWELFDVKVARPRRRRRRNRAKNWKRQGLGGLGYATGLNEVHESSARNGFWFGQEPPMLRLLLRRNLCRNSYNQLESPTIDSYLKIQISQYFIRLGQGRETTASDEKSVWSRWVCHQGESEMPPAPSTDDKYRLLWGSYQIAHDDKAEVLKPFKNPAIRSDFCVFFQLERADHGPGQDRRRR